MADYQIDKPQRILAEYFDSQGMNYLDLLPIMRQEAHSKPLYYALDQHWNERGNALAGRAIAGFLVERGLVTGQGITPYP
jgi:hypothetical protein